MQSDKVKLSGSTDNDTGESKSLRAIEKGAKSERPVTVVSEERGVLDLSVE